MTTTHATPATTSTAVDPITTEVIRNALNSAADEMNATLIRSAYTWIIYELKDCSVALLDADHRVLGQSAGLPIFLGNLEVCTRVTEEMYGREAWQPGDVWIMNDSYLAGTHLNDITVYGPIFHDGEIVGFAASRAHWLDVGAKDAGAPMDSTEIYQEGLRLGPTKVVEGGRERRDIVDLLGRNSRFSYPAIGDLNAQIACARTGERRLAAIIERFGTETVAAARDEIFAQTERLERIAIGEIPDGVYEAEGALDNDGLTDTPVAVRVMIEIRGGDMTIDLRATDDAAAGPVNCGEAQAISACRVAYKLLVAPDLPTNGGSFAPLSVEVRRGSVVGAQEPSPCAWYFSPLGLLIDLVVKALSPVLPQKAAAASYGDSMIVTCAGLDQRTGEGFFHIEPTVGGWGAWEGSDGESGLINSVNAGMKDFPIEILETRIPLHVRRYGFRADSGGSGKWRGGNGVVREFEIECDQAFVSLWWERSKTPAWGLFGGEAATPPDLVINPGRDDERHILKATRLVLKRGDVIRGMSGGGGGFGDPAERAPQLLQADIRDGHVSAEAAARLYGTGGSE
ncbi:MAG TPA: hydantoinase B/oxoprolinase family protein [Gaiellaceae bacterium]|nr:hydantoinase B/oxoprolinase family protein [Gaiellaceae bacterium]